MLFPEPWGRWTQFDEHIFQMGWFNHPAVFCWVPWSPLLFQVIQVQVERIRGTMTEWQPPYGNNWYHHAIFVEFPWNSVISCLFSPPPNNSHKRRFIVYRDARIPKNVLEKIQVVTIKPTPPYRVYPIGGCLKPRTSLLRPMKVAANPENIRNFCQTLSFFCHRVPPTPKFFFKGVESGDLKQW